MRKKIKMAKIIVFFIVCSFFVSAIAFAYTHPYPDTRDEDEIQEEYPQYYGTDAELDAEYDRLHFVDNSGPWLMNKTFYHVGSSRHTTNRLPGIDNRKLGRHGMDYSGSTYYIEMQRTGQPVEKYEAISDDIVAWANLRSYVEKHPSVFSLKKDAFLPWHYTMSEYGYSWGSYSDVQVYYNTNGNLKHVETRFGKYTTNSFIYAAVFSKKELDLEKNYHFLDLAKGDSYNSSDAAQKAIWAVVENTNKSTYYNQVWAMGQIYDVYEEEVGTPENPVITTGSNAGTVLTRRDEEDYYRIGPFNINDYEYFYSQAVPNKYLGATDGIMAGITGGKIVLANDNNVKTGEVTIDGSNCKIEYSSSIPNETHGNLDSDVAAQFGGKNEWGAPPSYKTNNKYPWPNTQFYIVVKKSLCDHATKLSSLDFKYRKTTASGDGWVITAKAKKNGEGTKQDTQPLLIVSDARVHVWEEKISCGPVRLTTNISVNKYIVDTYHNMPEALKKGTDYTTSGKTGLNTSLTKADGEKRANKSDAEKENSPVYAEYGDTVVYNIDIYNKQAAKVKVALRDVLPEGYIKGNIRSIKNLTTNTDLSSTSSSPGENQYKLRKAGDFFTGYIWVNGGTSSNPGKTTIEVRVLVNSNNTAAVLRNEVILCTNNAGNRSVDNCRNTIRGDNNGSVVNVNSADQTYYGMTYNGNNDNPLVPNSSDYYKINDYKVSIKTYISQYDSFGSAENNNLKITRESTKDGTITQDDGSATRAGYNESKKQNYPLAVDQGDKLVYDIVVKNDATTSGYTSGTNSFANSAAKKATQARPTQIIDYLDRGLELDTSVGVSAKIYDRNGNPITKYSSTGTNNVSVTASAALATSGSAYTLSIGDGTILNPGDYIVYKVPVIVKESNMYLYSLQQKAEIGVLTNINHHSKKIPDNPERIVKSKSTGIDLNTWKLGDEEESSSEFIRMKDLVISGYVWLDKNKDGFMPGDPTNDSTFTTSIDVGKSTTTHGRMQEEAMENIVVNLYRIGPKGPDEPADTDDSDLNKPRLIRTVKTNRKGQYSFGYKDNTRGNLDENWRNGVYSIESSKATDSDQRIIKATNKNTNTQKYSSDSQLYSYYVEFEYDGIVYKSTAYSNKTHLNDDGTMKTASADAKTKDPYKKDSNAVEFKSDINTFDLDHEIVGYNYTADKNNENKVNLTYEKKGHSSFLKHSKARVVAARSFVKDEAYDDESIVSDSQKIGGTNLLWLFNQGSTDVEKPSVDYLKFINLGLNERENIDINVVQDVYNVKNIINGEEMTYNYNQNEFATDSYLDEDNERYKESESKVDLEQPLGSTFSFSEYMTGYTDDDSALTAYNFKYYDADYDYKVNQYNIPAVQRYKTKYSELNSEISLRIKITNNFTSNFDTPDKEDKLYVGINEVAEYFDKDFMNIQYNPDGTVKEIDVKTKDENGYLITTPLKIAKAYYVLPNNSKSSEKTGNLILSADSLYNNSETAKKATKEKVEAAGYNTVYIRKSNAVTDKMMIAEGENVDIIITFIVGKPNRDSNDPNNRKLNLGLKNAIAEISAYSTYRDEKGEVTAGLVDKDSNPGNFGETYSEYSSIPFTKTVNGKTTENADYLQLYEDDTFKTAINLEVNGVRTTTGKVWDDARTETVINNDGAQYIGDGKYDRAKTANAVAKKNPTLGNKENKDSAISGVGATMVETIKIPVYKGGTIDKEIIYEDTIKPSDSKSDVSVRTNNEGVYRLKGYIPGEYIVKFSYGDKVDGKVSEQMQIFNGQDYKSTTYQKCQGMTLSDGSTIDCYADTAYLGSDKTDAFGEPKKNTDKALEILEKEGLSDAKDDEIRRLETITYSETLNNNKTMILRGKDSINRKLQAEEERMFADTAEFLVRAEKEKSNVTVLTYAKTKNKFEASKRHPIENIDFGLQFRPVQQVVLNNYIKNLTITTSDKGTDKKEYLVDAKFNEYYGVVINTDTDTGVTEFLTYTTPEGNNEILKVEKDSDVDTLISKKESKGCVFKNKSKMKTYTDKLGNTRYQIILAGTELDKENSIGLSNVQFVANDRDSHDENSTQGFLYLNIDDEIMQGAEVNIEYLYTGNNISEIDRVSENLSNLKTKAGRSKGLATTSGLEGTLDESSANKDETVGAVVDDLVPSGPVDKYEAIEPYSGAAKARNDLFYRYYEIDYEASESIVYGEDSDNDPVTYRIRNNMSGKNKVGERTIGINGYYGKYLGTTYYTGEPNNKETVSELRIDKILNYVDNNLVFKTEDNQKSDEDYSWRSTSASELVLGGFVSPETLKFEKPTSGIIPSYVKKFLTVRDINGKFNENDVYEIKAKIAELIQQFSNKAKLLGVVGNLEVNSKEIVTRFLSGKMTLEEAKNPQIYLTLLNKGLLLDSEDVAYDTEKRTNLALLESKKETDKDSVGDTENIIEFLYPRDSRSDESFAKASIVVSKIISAEDDTKDMIYENAGEIIEYSSVTGRVTNANSNIGSADLSYPSTNFNSAEYEQSQSQKEELGIHKESDTSGVERVTLTPPTGLSKTDDTIRKAVTGATYIGIIGIITLIVIFGTIVGIKLYRNRKIK